jgi:phenol hydroxylase P1 protein
MGYELRTNVVDPERNTFSYLVERFGDRPATRYQEASFNIQPKENFHYWTVPDLVDNRS